MNEIHFKNLDLNLLRILLTLLDNRSVSRAAEELALTPSAVSHALGRLRTALDDPLFERGGGGLVPTARALEIGRRVRPAIDQLREAVEPGEFNPATAEREFVVAAGPYAAAVVLPSLVDRLAAIAPGVRLRLRRPEEQSIEDVDLGRFDFMIGPPSSLRSRLEWLPLLVDDLVWIARRGHPQLAEPLTMDMLLAARHVIIEKIARQVSPAYPELRQFFDETRELRDATAAAADTAGRRRTPPPAVIVTDVMQAMAMVARSDLAMLSLRRLAAAFPAGLQLMTPPHDTPEIEMGAIFLPARQRDAGFKWLMGELQDVCKGN